ncbi:beta-1,3-galactosyltransferase brn-like isoform X3 [Mytilus trossulus]|uniref:beta-1,3-galactosyltransferase brn-like isoform X3 n=1 Tax=Mytilus trossulus TaxID=6551 RepID=UPI0030076886
MQICDRKTLHYMSRFPRRCTFRCVNNYVIGIAILCMNVRELTRGKKWPWIICTLLVLLVLRRWSTGEKIYFFQFTYPLHNLIDVVEEIATTGQTTENPLNNVTKHYVIKKDPFPKNCGSESCDSFDIVFIVKSFVGNFGQRVAIRNTWGSKKNPRVKTLFVLGYLESFQPFVDFEYEKFGDILQFGFKDTYDSLVYKTILPIDWLVKRNINTKYVHFLDDDRLVNTRRLLEFANDNIGITEKKIIGHKMIISRPYRDKSSKWFTSLEEYPFDYWPQYLIGGTLLTNMKVVKSLAYSIPFTRIIRMEDAFIGILSKLLKINVVHNCGFMSYFTSGSDLKDKLSSPDYKSYNSLIDGWKQLQN